MNGIRFYVGVTDSNWFRKLSLRNDKEINFWTPGAITFKTLLPGEMFLFKLHKPNDYIVGGGFFHNSRFCQLTWHGMRLERKMGLTA